MSRFSENIKSRLLDENGASLVEAAIGMPIMNLVIFGYIVLAYGTILLMSSINDAGASLVNYISFHEKSWLPVTEGYQVVIAKSFNEQKNIGDLVERNRFYDFDDLSMRGFANTLGGVLTRFTEINYMRNPDVPVSELTVQLNISREKIASDHDAMRATVMRESPLLPRAVRASIYAPFLN